MKSFNLRREAIPLATYAYGVPTYQYQQFQSQARSQSTGDVLVLEVAKPLILVSISGEKPIHWRRQAAFLPLPELHYSGTFQVRHFPGNLPWIRTQVTSPALALHTRRHFSGNLPWI